MIGTEQSFEYSSREVSPAALLLQQLLRAHDIFLLHHAISLADLFSRNPREKFCRYLKTFWDRFLETWVVLLHGNPAVEIYNGLKLATSGELGVGVGAEHRGSGEREVLEGFVRRTDGLVDLLVSRFECLRLTEGVKPVQVTNTHGKSEGSVNPDDGVVFTGIGAISKKSIKDVSAWMEWIAMFGMEAYGIRDGPTSRRRRKRSRQRENRDDFRGKSEERKPEKLASSKSAEQQAVGIPASILRSKQGSNEATPSRIGNNMTESSTGNPSIESFALGTEMMKYLTLGVYGSSWGLSAGRPTASDGVVKLQQRKSPTNDLNIPEGRFLIGLLDKLEDEIGSEPDSTTDPPAEEGTSNNTRISIRSVHVECLQSSPVEGEASRHDETPQLGRERLRVVVYLHKPFIFTFFFRPGTEALSLASFYRSLHHQLGPLRGPLEQSTDADRSRQRLWDAVGVQQRASDAGALPMQDLVFDPVRLTVRTSIPDIPEPRLNQTLQQGRWSRVEALSVHMHILNAFVSTRQHLAEVEQSCKTSRGWWIVWLRLPARPQEPVSFPLAHREAILVRRGDSTSASRPRHGSSNLVFGLGRSRESAAKSSDSLAGGTGIDTRRYIESLLSLSL